MAVQKPKLRKNVEGFIDHQGLFHPIRSGEKEQGKRYSAKKAGDKDDIFEREARKHKNRVKAEQIWEKRLMDEALDNALGEESKVSLAQFVRRNGGLKFDSKSNDPYNGEIETFTFKQSKVKGLAHPNGKKSLDSMREAADEAGYATPDGNPLSTINDFLDALSSDLRGKKIYPFGTAGAYKFNPNNNRQLLERQAAHLARVIRKLKKRKGTKTKVARLEHARELALKLAKGTKPTAQTLKKNGIIATAADLFVGASAAVGLIDRFTKKKPISKKRTQHGQVVLTNNPLKKNKGESEQKAIHQKSFENALVAIESGDLSKQDLARIQGKLAGFEPNEVSRAIQYARLTYKLKQNPTPAILKQAQNAILKENGRLKANGIVGRVLARHKAGKLYKRQLRLEAAIDRAKKSRAAAEAKAKKNPAKVYVSGVKTGLDNRVRIIQLLLEKNKKPVTAAMKKAADQYLAGKLTFDELEKVWKQTKKNPATKQNGVLNNLLKPIGYKLEQVKKTVKKNPSKTHSLVSPSFEAFQGRKPTEVIEMATPEDAPRHLWSLGKLFELRLKGKPNITFRRETTGKTFRVCSNEKNEQLWIAGGAISTTDENVKPGYSEPYAVITHIVYETKKVHLDDKKDQGYIHKFGEEGGKQPVLAFDRNGYPIIVGGSYEITPLGIAD